LVLSSWSDRAHVEKRGQAWLDTLVPVIEAMRATLRNVGPDELAARSGARTTDLQPEGRKQKAESRKLPTAGCLLPTDLAVGGLRSSVSELWLHYLGREYRIAWPELVAYPAGSDQPCPGNLQGLFLYYLSHADGTPLAGRWLSFRELPGGGFYHRAFQGYTGNRLARHFGNDLEAFRQAARALDGFRLDLGDAAFSFDVLPRVRLAVIYWAGDDEFTPSAQVLFDASVSHYLPTDACAVLGSQLVDRLSEWTPSIAGSNS
jgi:hypothetical protein